MFQSFERTTDGSQGPARLTALRQRLRDLGVDGLLVPRADAHQGEMVAPRDERLAWLTGFSGSAGMAVVLPERAAVLVDGRYTLQAAAQVNGDAFEIVASHQTRPADWLATALEAGQRIGYDPWLHGKDEIDRFSRAAALAEASLVPLGENPIDAVWTDQPPVPTGSVTIHDEALAGETAAAKRARVGAAIAAAGADALLVTLPDNLAWLLNIRGADLPRSPVALGFALLAADGRATLFMEPDKIGGAVRAHLGEAVEVRPADALGPALDRLSGKRVLLDKATAPLWAAARLEAAAARPVWDSDPVTAMKARKTEAELDGTRAAHRRDGAAMVRFLHWLETETRAGVTLTEIDAVRALERFRIGTGALQDISFDTIAGSGPNGAIVHYRVTRETNRTLARGELFLVDSGGQYRDGTTDITRTVALGDPPEDARRAFTLVLKGLIALSTARWPAGLAGRDLDPLARQHLWRAGLDYDHGTGHGVGVYLNVHEGPASLSRRSGKVALEPGTILSIEPGCYREGAWGIRVENLAAVTPPETPDGGARPMLGFETLTLCPIDRALIVPALLDPDERAWLDAYHRRVAAELRPLVDGGAADWLEGATAPLAPAAAVPSF